MSTRNVQYIIELRDRFTRNLKGANAAMRSMNASTSAFRNTLSTLAPYLSAAFLVRGVSRSIKAFGLQEQALAQVRQGIESTNMVANRTFDQLAKQAKELQDIGIFGDEQILQGVTAQLLTFTNITGKQFDRAQRAILDVTTRLYGADASAESLRSTSIQLAKALNDPVSNLGALSRSGIQFSKSQKEIIKSLTESGNIIAAQQIILTELEKQYGGSAVAAAQTFAGSLKQTRNEFGDLMEVIGKQFVPILQDIIPGIRQNIKWLSENEQVISNTIKKIKFIIKTLITYKAVMLSMRVAYKAVMLSMRVALRIATVAHNTFRFAMIAYNRGVKSAIRLTKGFNAAMKANVIGFVVTGIIALIQKLRGMRNEMKLTSDKFEELGVSKETIDAISKAASSASDNLSKFSKVQLRAAAQYLQDIEEGLPDLVKVPETVKKLGGAISLTTPEKTIDFTKRKAEIRRQIDYINKILEQKGVKQFTTGETKVQQRTTTITSRSPKVINITINKLIETQEINTKVLSESTSKIKQMITQTILEAINDTQIAQRAS